MKALHLFLLIILASPLSSIAQTKAPSVEVQGAAILKTQPDLTVVTISFNSVNMAFNKAVKNVNTKNETLIKQLEKSGFKKEEIKSSSFNAGKNIFWGKDRQIDSGYVATQTVILEFPYNKERVTKLVESFTESTIGLEFNFNFILSESKTKEVKNKLIELSILNAKEKAEIIAKTSAVKLSGIQSIQYGTYEDMNRSQAMFRSKESDSSNPSGFGGLNISDIELTDRVTITWNISQ